MASGDFAVEINRFKTVNTRDSSVTMEDDELPILINLMPIGTSLYSIPGFSAAPLVVIGSQEAARPRNTAVVAGLHVVKQASVTGQIYVCSQSGTTEDIADPSDAWSTSSEVTDGTAKWMPYSSTVKRFADVNLNNTVYKLVATVGGALYLVNPTWVQFRLNVPSILAYSDPRFEQWKYTNALIIDPTAGYYDYDGQPGADRAAGTIIATTTTKVKTANAINFVAGTTQGYKAATDNLWTLSGTTVLTGNSNSYYLYLDTAGNPSIVEGTPAATVGAIIMPAKDTTKALIGMLTISTSGASFIPGTTALSAATVTDVYSDNVMLLHHTTLSAPTAGTCLAIWKGRVWYANGRTIGLSAPDSFTDFTTASAGGTVIDTYSSLRTQINNMVAAQDYLYIVGDHATHVISGLQIFSNTSTIFNLTDAVPGIGSPYADTVQVLGGTIVHTSDTGVNAVAGGTYELLSSYLDGMFPNIDTSFKPVAFFAKIFNKLCYSLLVYAKHPIDGSLQKMILCYYESRWFYVFYGHDFVFVAQSATATDTKSYAAYGNNIIQIFTSESYCMKKARLKALNMGAPFNDKAATTVGATLVNSTGLTSDILATMSVIGSGFQSDSSQDSRSVTFSPGTVIWYNASNQVVPWNYGSSNVINWIKLYSDMLGMSQIEARGKRLQIDFEESSAAAYAITGMMIGGYYGVTN